MIERYAIKGREEWLERRKRYMFHGSSLAAIFNEHPYITPLKLHLEASGMEFQPIDPRLAYRGLILEPAVAKGVSLQRPAWDIAPAGEMLSDTELSLEVTPDFYIHHDERGLGVLETKTCSPSVYDRDYVAGPPLCHIMQTLVAMKLAGATFGYIGVMVVDPYDLQVHLTEVPLHEAAWAKIVERMHQFRRDVEAGHEPKVDFGRDSEAIRLMTQRATAGKTFDGSGNNELPLILAQRAALMARIKQDEARCQEIENEVKLLLSDAESVTNLAGWRVTFKTTERAGYTVAPKSVRSLRISDRRPAVERPDAGDAEEEII